MKKGRIVKIIDAIFELLGVLLGILLIIFSLSKLESAAMICVNIMFVVLVSWVAFIGFVKLPGIIKKAKYERQSSDNKQNEG